MRKCDSNCEVLPYIKGKVCPMLRFSAQRYGYVEYFEYKKQKLKPLCETKNVEMEGIDL